MAEKNKEKVCFIVGAGNMYGNICPDKEDIVIAADGGYRHLEKLGITPDITIGDFDSLNGTPQRSKNTITLPKEKDDTDTLAAVRTGLEKGFSLFHIYGGTGGRSDHTVANIQTLSFIRSHKASGFLFGENEVFTVIDSEIGFESIPCGYISVFALGKAEGVTISGLKYSAENVSLDDCFPLGTSNEFIGKESKISVKEGRLLIVFPCKYYTKIIW